MIPGSGGHVQIAKPSSYRPLSVADERIRLLTLHPARRQSSPIRCTLSSVSLQQNPLPAFEALSYVWGSPDATEPIFVDGHLCKVTESLEDALRRLRRRWRSRVLWIDQICINQHDLLERRHQVMLMGKLYSKAERVLAWLGSSSDPKAEEMLDWVRHWIVGLEADRSFGQLYITSPYWSIGAICRKATYAGMRCMPLDKPQMYCISQEFRSLRQVQRVLSMFDNFPYWTRMWVLQEFILPEQSPLLLFGNLGMDETFVHAAQWARSGEGLFKKMSETLLKPQQRRQSQLLGDFDAIRTALEADQAEQLSSIAYQVGFMKHLIMRDLRREEKQKLSSLLKYTYGLRCRDPRDKVFSLYFASQNHYDLPQPDYETPSDIAIRSFVSQIINVEGNLRIYDWLSPSSVTHGYPSWTPDFTVPDAYERHALYASARDATFCPQGAKASGDRVVKAPAASIDLQSLRIHGWTLGEVDAVFNLPEIHGEQQILEAAWACSRHAEAMAEIGDGDTRKNVQIIPLIRNTNRLQEILENIKNTASCLDPGRKTRYHEYISLARELSGRSLHQQYWDNTGSWVDGESISTLLAEFLTSGSDDCDLLRKVELARSYASDCEQSTLFCTRSGQVGLVYDKQKIRAGDVVAIISGCDYPYILRPAESGWAMIGSSYVSGVMEGEAVRWLECGGLLETSLETFEIV